MGQKKSKNLKKEVKLFDKKKENNLIKKKEIEIKIKLKSTVNFLLVTEFENKKILIVTLFDSIIIYDLENFKQITSILFQNYSHSIVKLKNNIFLMLSDTPKTFIINKREDKYFIEFKKLIKKDSNQINNLTKSILSQFTDNTLISMNMNSIEIDELEYINEDKEIFIKRKLISIIRVINLQDILEIDKEKIAYVNNDSLGIVSKTTNQIIINYKIGISMFCTEIFQMLNEDILCFGGGNNIFFISIKLSVILYKLCIGKNYKIIAMERLNDENIVVAALNNNQSLYCVNLLEINCLDDNKLKKKEKKFIANVKNELYSNKNSSGNWYMRKINDESFVTSELNFVYLWK